MPHPSTPWKFRNIEERSGFLGHVTHTVHLVSEADPDEATICSVERGGTDASAIDRESVIQCANQIIFVMNTHDLLVAALECNMAMYIPLRQGIIVLEKHGWSHANRFNESATLFVQKMNWKAMEAIRYHTYKEKFKKPEGHKCGVSSGIHEGVTFGTGNLDSNGYWEHPCWECARAWESQYPLEGPAWPFDHEGDKKSLKTEEEK